MHSLLDGFERWPTWMWANEEVASFLDWLRGWNDQRPVHRRVGFYGLDVYSLWDSLREIIGWLAANVPDSVPAALRAWQCFLPHHEDPQQYAWSTRLVPRSCEADVVDLLTRSEAGLPVRGSKTTQPSTPSRTPRSLRTRRPTTAPWSAATGSPGTCGTTTWRTRSTGSAGTWDPVRRGSSGNTTPMWGMPGPPGLAQDGLVNIGQLLRQRHASEGVMLVGLGSPPGHGPGGRHVGQPGTHPASAGSTPRKPRGLPA